MKIKKDSWHYRTLVSWQVNTHKHPSKNLCIYFWQVVVATLGNLLMAIVLLLLAAFVGMTLISWVYLPYLVFIHGWEYLSIDDNPHEAFIGFGMGGWAVFTGAVIFATGCLIKNGVDSKKQEPGLVASYIRAKKDKICPLIEFE